MKRNIHLFLLLLSGEVLFAETSVASSSGTVWGLHPLLVTIIFVITIILLLLTLMLASQLYKFVRKEAGLQERYQRKKRPSLWSKLLQLKPLDQEKDMLTDHEYDGIKELNNPTPAWFMTLFYGTIVFGLVYMFYYHVMENKLMAEEYQAEMQNAEEEKEAWLAKQPVRFNEDSIKFDLSSSVISEGKAIFNQYCFQCHGKLGEGLVGPNLTDEYWLHGSTAKAIFRTIREGVPDKGMIAWKGQLRVEQIISLVSYIKSIEGTNPAGAKEPQGEKSNPTVRISDSTTLR